MTSESNVREVGISSVSTMEEKRRKIFQDKLQLRSAECKSVVLTKAKYSELIDHVKEVKECTRKRSPRDYWLLKHYDVIEARYYRT